jgi:hypothetical protein
VNLIIGVVLSILFVVIGIIIGFFLLRRRGCHNRGVETQASNDADHSILKMNFIDDHIDGGEDTMLTTYTDQVTNEGDSQIPASITTDFTVNLRSLLIEWD